MLEFFIAKKHILERKRQSVIAILGIIIGISVLTVAIAISNGLDENMINNILSMTPHVKVTNSSATIENYLELANEIKKIKGVKGVVPKYSTQAILKYEGESGTYVSGVMVEGIDNKSIDILQLNKKKILGEISLLNSNDILIGKELFMQLGAKIGDTIKIVSSENKEVYMNIKGVFQTGFYDFDTSMVIMPLETVQIIYDTGDVVTTLDVRLENVYDANKIASIINNRDEFLIARTWGELNKNLLSALSLEKNVMIIILSLLVIISGFVIGVILNTMVKEKTKDIGIMRSFGLSSNKIMKIFMIEGILLGITGILIGTLISVTIIELLRLNIIKLPTDIYYLDRIPVSIELIDFIKIDLMAFVVIFLSSVQPANKAAKLVPVEAMRYE